MPFLSKILSFFMGDKSKRDIKEVMPIVEEIQAEYNKLSNISNDELRAIASDLKQEVADYISEETSRIDALKKEAAQSETSVSKREAIFSEIDSLESDIDEKIEDILNQILPAAFAVMQDTARRFSENETLEVTASDFDRELAAQRKSITINGDKALYSNSWEAGGSTIVWNMIHYEVQLVGGVILHQGKAAEMATGEGKTLVATLPVFLNALTGRGVHLVTVNDYLAKRDAEWMGPLYEFHGLSVDCIDKHEPNSTARRNAYMSDVTFGTNNAFGFDYLRDNMTINPNDLVQRRHNYAIVDEVDSVLIDDARTPLIISGPVSSADKDKELFDEYKPKVIDLYKHQKSLVTKLLAEAKKDIESKDKKTAAHAARQLLRAHKGLPKYKPLIKFLSEEGIKTTMHQTENIYLQENAKRMPEITDKLYFVIDEKNNSIELTDQGIDLISGSVDDSTFFVMPDIGSEVADIENSDLNEEEKIETKDKLMTDFAIKSERLHTVNQLLKAYAMFELDIDYVVMDSKVKIVDEQTGRIMEGRRYSDGLHQAIESKENVKVEASTQTFATITLQNYFRMYHKLAGMTGTAETEAKELWDIYELDVVVIPTNKPIIRDDRQDKVYKTAREKYNAVVYEINDLVKKGRPVLVGTTSVEISETLSKILKRRKIDHSVLNAKLHQREADIVANAGVEGHVTIATNMAGRGTDIKISDEVIEAGGLAIIATERHDSRRVDRQLRGRSGRQGDAGSSQFFVSLEDNLMRMFGSDRISKLMDRMGLEEGEVIQHSMISKSIERAQKKVEENNFGIRKRLLEYDDVMNSQREVIYKLRRHSLHGDRTELDISNMMYDTVDSLVNQHHGIDFEAFKMDITKILAVPVPFSEEEFFAKHPDKLIEPIYELVLKSYARRKETLVKQAQPLIENVYKKLSGQYKNIELLISDGIKTFRIIVNLEKAYESKGEEVGKAFEKQILLRTIDDTWKEHLREMDDLKQSVQNASYEQKDPLLIYKFESYELFRTMIDSNNKEIVSSLLKAQLVLKKSDEVQSADFESLDMDKFNTKKEQFKRQGQTGGGGQGDGNQEKLQPIRKGVKIGRNDIVKIRFNDGRVVEGKYKKYIRDIENQNAVLIK
ncbi:MAG: preprotein translocase subunit SecA [Bacteroidota bacterium]|nr:preprotein translocase subunit SecA [Bacteroidota bacterium]